MSATVILPPNGFQRTVHMCAHGHILGAGHACTYYPQQVAPVRYQEAVEDALRVLGRAPCDDVKCKGCEHEWLEARAILEGATNA